MINDYVKDDANTTDVFYRFVKYSEPLAYCELKNIQKMGQFLLPCSETTSKEIFGT